MPSQHKRRRSRLGRSWNDPVRRYPLITFGAAALLTAVLLLAPIRILPAWLISISAVTFLAYGYDKSVANVRSGWMRVPEATLLALTLAGGTVGALAGMMAFRHKTIKPEFRSRFWLIVGAQVVTVGVLILSTG